MKPSARKISYFVGSDSRPSAAVMYDSNKDGKQDLAVNNSNNEYILILNGPADGTFVKGKTYSNGNKSAPTYQRICESNNDNRMYLVIANIGTDSTRVLLGQDNGTFATVTQYSTGVGSGPCSVAIGDVNNDDQLDIVSANTGSSSVGVLLGNGNETFKNVQTYPTNDGSSPYSVAVGDINSGNHIDIFVSLDTPDILGIYFEYGNGIYRTITNYNTGLGSSPFAVALANFNRDKQIQMLELSEFFLKMKIKL